MDLSQLQSFDMAGCQYVAPCAGSVWPVVLDGVPVDFGLQQDLSAAALNGTATIAGHDFKLSFVSMACDVPLFETFTIWLDSVLGAAYDSIIAQWTLINERYLYFAPTNELVFTQDSLIRCTCTNNAGAGVVSAQVTLCQR